MAGIIELLSSAFFAVPTWLSVIACLLYTYYIYLTWNYGVFKKLGIPGPKPVPVFGTTLPMMQVGMAAHDVELKKYGKVVGTFQGRRPIMVVFDTEILKQILVKEFTNFTDRQVLPLGAYPLDKMVSLLEGDHWRHVRSVLTPTFSSGKLRRMNEQIQKCSETLIANLTEKARKGEVFDLKEFCSAFTMDVIASTAFGIEIDSHNDPNNEFVKNGKLASGFTFTSPLMLITFFFPFLAKPLMRLGLTLFPQAPVTFFCNVIDKTLQQRQLGGEQKKIDFLQLMAEARIDDSDATSVDNKTKEKNEGDESVGTKAGWRAEKGLTHEEVLAQGVLFFLAGFETTANTLSLLGYSLATNPDCQEKLLREIDDVMKDHDRVDYDVVHKMPYLDMCLSETLRICPPAIRTDRVCLNDITINGVFIPKGMLIGSPIYVMHMDPEVWPEPTKFNPERFTTEAKEARNSYHYMPFGVGPRNCVGMRLALTELKMATVSILKTLKFVVCPETKIPLTMDKVVMKSVDGIKLKMEIRQK